MAYISRFVREKVTLDLIDDNMNCIIIAKKYNIKVGHVLNVRRNLTRAGFTVPKRVRKVRKFKIGRRTRSIMEQLLKTNFSFSQIARNHKVSRQWVFIVARKLKAVGVFVSQRYKKGHSHETTQKD